MDLWMLGIGILLHKCRIDMYSPQIYEIAIGKPLFQYKANQTRRLDEVEAMFYQMMCFSCEKFEPEQLQHAKMASKYFESTCKNGGTLMALVYDT
jgi:hypothetical protein